MKIEAILAKIDSLPPMPAVAVQLLKAARDPDVDLGQVGGWIRRDPSMTANLLRLANSPYFGLRSEVTSVRQATTLLGLKKVVQIALMVLSSRYLAPAQGGYDLAAGELWKSSVASAIAAELLARRAGYPDASTAYTAGLLQDVGKIVLADFVADALPEIRRLVDAEGWSWEEAERQAVGAPHPEVGALLLERWGFPEALVESVRYHHAPKLATVDPLLARLSHLADALTMSLGAGLGADGLAYDLDDAALACVGIRAPGDVDALLEELATLVEEAQTLFSVKAR
ncbi:MAG: HDOD domain-containing protein [Deferrisomatales bacterium]